MALLSRRRIRWIITGIIAMLLLYQMVSQEKKMKQTTQQYRNITKFGEHQANSNRTNGNNNNHNNRALFNHTLQTAFGSPYNSSHSSNQTVPPPSTALPDQDESDLSLSTTTTTVIPSAEPQALSNETAGIVTAENVPSDETPIINISMAANTATTAPEDSEISSSTTTATIPPAESRSSSNASAEGAASALYQSFNQTPISNITTTTNTLPATNDSSTTTRNTTTTTSTTSSSFSFQFQNISQRFPLPASAHWLQDFLTTQPTSTHLQSLTNPDQKFIVMTCHKYERRRMEACGGFTDRVKLIPYYMWLAKHTNRMLLIKYTKPHSLEHFLEPPPDPDHHPFEWRVPEGYFQDELQAYANRTQDEYSTQRRTIWHQDMVRPEWLATRVIFVNNNLAQLPSLNHLERVGQVVTSDVQARVFRHLFYPTKALQEHIQATAAVHHLVPGQYAGVHMRAKYPAKDSNITLNWGLGDKEGGGIRMDNHDTKRAIAEMVDNAMNCVMTVMPDTPIVYFASDSNEPMEYLLKESIWAMAGGTTNNFTHPYPKWYATQSPPPPSPPPPFPVRRWNTTQPVPTVVARLDFEVEPIHFDTDRGRGPQPKDMYPTFVDLWILAHAKCISQGVGGYSEFASQLTGNFRSCRAIHRHKTKGILKCPDYLQQQQQPEQEPQNQ